MLVRKVVIKVHLSGGHYGFMRLHSFILFNFQKVYFYANQMYILYAYTMVYHDVYLMWSLHFYDLNL